MYSAFCRAVNVRMHTVVFLNGQSECILPTYVRTYVRTYIIHSILSTVCATYVHTYMC